MIRRDWCKRHIELLAQALGLILGRKKEGEIQAAISESEKAIRKVCGMDGKLALGLPLDEFLKLTCRGEQPTAEFLNALADLFREWAVLLETQNRPAEASAASAHAHSLLQLAESKMSEDA